MFEIEKRKKNTKWSVRQIEKIFLNFTNKREYAGLILVGVHYLVLISAISFLFFGVINVYYYISLSFYLLCILLHYYYNGCILTRTERSLLDAKTWYGPPSILLYGVKDFTMERCNNMIAYMAVIVVSNSFLRLYNKDINLFVLIVLTGIYFRNN
jgi:hypothetical protein